LLNRQNIQFTITLHFAKLGVMKLANFITKLQDVLQPNRENINLDLRRRTGRRLNVAGKEADRLYNQNRKKVVRVEYTGPTKTVCIGCGIPFLFSADDRGRHPDYHSNACKQKTYRERKKERGR
jgi:hypothetical protein